MGTLLVWVPSAWNTLEQHPGLTIRGCVEHSPGAPDDPNVFNWHVTFFDAAHGDTSAHDAAADETSAKTAVEVSIAQYRKKKAA